MKVEVVTRHRSRRLPHRKIREVIAGCAFPFLPLHSVISVAFLNDAEMTEINEAYTGRLGTTDVLSFPLGVDSHSSRWHGEILVSLDRAYKQAKDKGVLLIDEVIRLLIHAIVHLGGHDHYDRNGFKEMRKMEFELLLGCL